MAAGVCAASGWRAASSYPVGACVIRTAHRCVAARSQRTAGSHASTRGVGRASSAQESAALAITPPAPDTPPVAAEPPRPSSPPVFALPPTADPPPASGCAAHTRAATYHASAAHCGLPTRRRLGTDAASLELEVNSPLQATATDSAQMPSNIEDLTGNDRLPFAGSPGRNLPTMAPVVLLSKWTQDTGTSTQILQWPARA